jgi:hypothetical protein
MSFSIKRKAHIAIKSQPHILPVHRDDATR